MADTLRVEKQNPEEQEKKDTRAALEVEHARKLMRTRHEETRTRLLKHIDRAVQGQGGDIIALETLLARLDGFIP